LASADEADCYSRNHFAGNSTTQKNYMRCAIYSRVSTGKQETENQLTQLREFAKIMNWSVVAEYVDQVSGKSSERSEFQRMFQDASQRNFDVLLFWSLDRLSREGAFETLQHLNRLTGYGIHWRSLTEQYLDSTGIFREAVIAILAVIAKQERIRLSERTIAGLERARRQGRTLGRPRLNVSADAIREMRGQNLSWTAIAKTLGIARSTAQAYARQ
jgi:DNA invertase Pin-like site-specific DNA recombinase